MEMLGTSATTEEKPLLSDAPEMALPEGYKSSEQSGAAFAMPRIEDGSTERSDGESSAPVSSRVSNVSSPANPTTDGTVLSVKPDDAEGPADSTITWLAKFKLAQLPLAV